VRFAPGALKTIRRFLGSTVTARLAAARRRSRARGCAAHRFVAINGMASYDAATATFRRSSAIPRHLEHRRRDVLAYQPLTATARLSRASQA